MMKNNSGVNFLLKHHCSQHKNTMFITQMQILHSKDRNMCILEYKCSIIFSVYVFLNMCSGKVLFSLAVALSGKNKSKSHSLRWVTLCSPCVFEWQHKDGLYFLNYFCPLLFYSTLQRQTVKLELYKTSYTSFKVVKLMLLFSEEFVIMTVQRKNASDGSSWCHYWLPQLTWSDYHGLKIPYRFQSFLRILHGSERKSNNHPHETLTSTKRWSMKMIMSPFSCTVLKWFIFGLASHDMVLNFSS